MPTLTLTNPVTLTVASSGMFATNNANLLALLNSGLDYVNLKGNPQLVSGEAPIWNGTQFNRSSVTKLGINSLSGYPSDATKALFGDGTWRVPSTPVGIDYVAITSNVSITATTEGTAVTVITGTSLAYDTKDKVVEFFSPQAGDAVAATDFNLVLYRGATILGQARMRGNTDFCPLYVKFFDIAPPAGTYAYTVKAYDGNGSGVVWAGAGGSGTVLPAYLRVSLA